MILETLGGYDSEISILFVNNKKIRKLNSDYRKIDKPTDVLSFSQQEGDFNQISKNLLGDVVISAEYAMAESVKLKISFEAELNALLIHGILHLFGYDHEKSEKERKVMEKKEREILAHISKAE
jgi:rRNA maturation RNase YbeY